MPTRSQFYEVVLYHKVKDAQGNETSETAEVNATQDVIGDIELHEFDDKEHQLRFYLKDKAVYTDIATIGMRVRFTGGVTTANGTELQETWKFVTKAVYPIFRTNGEFNIYIIATTQAWVDGDRSPKDQFYPSKNSNYSWAQAPLKASKLIENLADEINLKIAQIKITHDFEFTLKQPARQYLMTDMEFIKDIAQRVRAKAWTEQYDGVDRLYVIDETVLMNNTAGIKFYLISPKNYGFNNPAAASDPNNLQIQNITIKQDSDLGTGENITTKTNPLTGEQETVIEKYDGVSKEWQEWVLDEETLRAEPPEVRDRLLKAFWAGNLDWAGVKDYFRRRDVVEQSSREPSPDGLEVAEVIAASPSGLVEETDGSGSLSTIDAFSNYSVEINHDAIEELSGEERDYVLGLIASGDLKWSSTDKFSTNQFLTLVEKEPSQVNNTDLEENPAGIGPVTKTDDKGFRIMFETYGDTRIRTKRRYELQGLRNYTGKYYLKTLVRLWGSQGHMNRYTFTR